MTLAAIAIRDAAPDDAGALAALHGDAWRGAYRGIIPALALERMIARRGAPWWRAAVSRAPSGVLALTFADELAGYVTLGPARRAVAGCRGEIYELYLRPEYQGLGMGARLFAAARGRLKQAGRHGLVVWALADNDAACTFYAGRGGNVTARSTEQFDGRRLEKLAYCWTA